MQNTIDVSAGGEYSFQVFNSKTGNVVKDYSKQKNLITDLGFLGSAFHVSYTPDESGSTAVGRGFIQCSIFLGDSPLPHVRTNVALHNNIGGSLTASNLTKFAPVTLNGSIVYKTECTFVSKTNIPFTVREVGLGNRATSLGALARITDQTNTPMEVKVGEDQYLKVTYRIVVGAAALNNRVSFDIALGGITKTFTASLGISNHAGYYNRPLLPRVGDLNHDLTATIAVVGSNGSGNFIYTKQTWMFPQQPVVINYNNILDILTYKGRYLIDRFSAIPYDHVLQAIDLSGGAPCGLAFGLFDIKSAEFPHGIPLKGNRVIFDYNFTMNFMRDI